MGDRRVGSLRQQWAHSAAPPGHREVGDGTDSPPRCGVISNQGHWHSLRIDRCLKMRGLQMYPPQWGVWGPHHKRGPIGEKTGVKILFLPYVLWVAGRGGTTSYCFSVSWVKQQLSLGAGSVLVPPNTPRNTLRERRVLPSSRGLPVQIRWEQQGSQGTLGWRRGQCLSLSLPGRRPSPPQDVPWITPSQLTGCIILQLCKRSSKPSCASISLCAQRKAKAHVSGLW